MKCLVQPVARRRQRMCVIMCVDPKAPLPQSAVQFLLRKFAGVLLHFVRTYARVFVSFVDIGVFFWFCLWNLLVTFGV